MLEAGAIREGFYGCDVCEGEQQPQHDCWARPVLLQLQQRCVEALRRSRHGVSGSLDGVVWLPMPLSFLALLECYRPLGLSALRIWVSRARLDSARDRL